LTTNPGAKDSEDTRILMINSKANSTDTNVPANKGYRSESISLEANSYYRFSISCKTLANGDESVNASIYISGLKNDDEDVQMGYENITSSIWKEYFFFIATGDASQTVNIDLYLGSASGQSSYGVAFFDNIHGEQLSQNAFFESCNNYGYTGVDTISSTSVSSTKFLVNGLKDTSAVVDTSSYNFDFEDPIELDSNTLGTKWSVIQKSNGHAVIQDIKNMQVQDFKDLTGYDYIGNDLSYQNKQALVLYTSKEGYVGVKSQSFDINVHQIYKFTMQVKVADMTSGSFYVKIQEDDKIYTLYSDLLSSNEDDKNYYELQSGKTSGISSNPTNSFTNNYQTISFYVKGHSLYNSSINLQLWLGDEETSAQGCVIVDNITLEHSDYESFSAASNAVELKSISSSPSTISNGYFNDTQNDSLKGSYPVKANNWTVTTENSKNINGVVYLYDQTTFDTMYSSYSWGAIYPGLFKNEDTINPANVFLMQNKTNSYQSLKSETYTIAEGGYYDVSFYYYNQNTTGLNSSKINVQIFDSNGITIFDKDFSSIDQWSNLKIQLHTAEKVSNEIYVQVNFGSNEDKVGGQVYLANFEIEESDETAFLASKNSVDMNDNYYLNLATNEISNQITSSPAYEFSIDDVYNSNYSTSDACAIGGIISGSNNPYIAINEDLKIEDSNYLAVSTIVESEATLKSKYQVNIESDSYYKLEFDLATIFNEIEDDSKYDYGAKITVSGYDAIKNLKTNNELKSFVVYLKSDLSSSANISLSLVSDSMETIGTALLTHLKFTSATENEYNNASLSSDYNKTIFTLSEVEEAEDDQDDEEKDDEQTSSSNGWLLVPSIITAVAVLVGVVGWAFKHVKVKKIEKIQQSTYDKKLAVNHDAIHALAVQERDREIKELNETKTALANEKVELEKEHRQSLHEQQKMAGGKLTKAMEKSFKEYNSKVNKINVKIDILNEEIESKMSAEYLLACEKKILAKQDEKKKK
jgi:hypothetical protein